jgi:hypothetical protein
MIHFGRGVEQLGGEHGKNCGRDLESFIQENFIEGNKRVSKRFYEFGGRFRGRNRGVLWHRSVNDPQSRVA